MLKLITKFLIFMVLVLALLALIIVGSNNYIVKHAKFKINKNTTAIVLGPSNPECAFNDSLIEHFGNYAESGEAYFYTYCKAKIMVEQNPQIKQVFVEFNNGLLDASMDDWTWADKITYRFSTYFPFLTAADQALIAKHNPLGYSNKVAVSTKSNLNAIIFHELDYAHKIGAYKHLVRDKTDSLLKALSLHPQREEVNTQKESVNLDYLEKLVHLLEKSNCKLYLIRSPLHEKFAPLSNDAIFKEILTSRFAQVEFLDFSKFPLLTSEYGDFDHVNYRGARKFSLWFDDLRKSGLMEQVNKQAFIDEKMKALTLGSK